MCLLHPSNVTRRSFLLTAPAFMASGSAAFSNPLENSDFTLPDSIADVRLPQTPLARDAALIMFSAVPRSIFNHCLRTFVLGMKDAQRRGLDVDTESAFHASILHDLCLAPTYPGSADKTFEENSADFAAAFARAAGLSDRPRGKHIPSDNIARGTSNRTRSRH